MANRKILLPLSALLILIIGAAGTIYWNIHKQRLAIASGLPEIPDLQRRPAALLKSIHAADSGIRSSLRPVRSLKTLSALYHSNGYLNEAALCYGQLISVDPENPHWPHLKASIHASYGVLETAIPLWKRSIELDPKYISARLQYGNALLKRNALQEAEAAYQEIILKAPTNAYALLGLARVEIEKQNWAGARTHLERATRASDFQIGTDLLATTYRELGEFERADTLIGTTQIGAYPQIPDPWLLAIHDSSYDPYSLSIAGGQAAHAGDTQAGIRLLRKAASLDPKDPMLRYQLATLLLSAREIREAEDNLRHCTRLKPDFSDAWIQLIQLYKNGGDAQRAQQSLVNGYRNCPESPALLLELGRLKSQDKQWNEAIPFLEKSIRLRPNEAEAYIELAQCYFNQDRAERGIREIRNALNVEPANPTALSTICYYTILQGDEKASRLYMRKIYLQPRITQNQVSELEKAFAKSFGRSSKNPSK